MGGLLSQPTFFYSTLFLASHTEVHWKVNAHTDVHWKSNVVTVSRMEKADHGLVARVLGSEDAEIGVDENERSTLRQAIWR